MTVTASYAEEHFAELLAAASCGENVEIATDDEVMLKLVRVNSTHPVGRGKRRILGAGRGELRVPSEEEWREFKKKMEHHMTESPLLSSGEI